MRALALLASLAAATVVEVILLYRILFHPAGGGDTPTESFVFVLGWAAVPLLWAALLIVFSVIKRGSLSRITKPILWVVLAGPVLLFIGLVQYGHATPGFMMLALLIQCVALIVGTVRAATPPNPTVERDARESGARSSV